MEEYLQKDYCRKCGAEVYPFSRKYSVSASEYYCIKCAEKVDREYLIKNSCSVCKRLLKKEEVKLVLPSKIYGSAKMPLMDRLICVQCYKSVGTRSMDRRSFRQRMEHIRSNIRKGIMRKAIRPIRQYS